MRDLKVDTDLAILDYKQISDRVFTSKKGKKHLKDTIASLQVGFGIFEILEKYNDLVEEVKTLREEVDSLKLSNEEAFKAIRVLQENK